MKQNKTYILNTDEIETIRRGMENPDYITDYWLRPTEENVPGFLFDKNFVEEGKWQRKVHHAKQNTIVIIGGVGTGKTLGIGISALVWAMTTESFKFLNVAQKEWQARLMYDLILERAEGSPLSKLIYSAPQRPYPKIIIRFQIGKVIYQSTLEFMSVDKDAKGIFSWRGDWINVEEAGLMDNLDEIARNLSTRLTGSTKRGRPFIGRFSFISNPWDTPHLWTLFDMAASDPKDSLSIVCSTRHNKNVTDKQIKDMVKHIPEDERERFLEGTRPEGKGSYFAKEYIYKAENQSWGEYIEEQVNKEKADYVLSSIHGAGVIEMMTPRLPGRLYFTLGDPGSDNAPNRNSPVIMTWDVTDFPKSKMRLVAFWWGFGNGKITPFIDKLLDHRSKFKSILTGIDSTGPQRSLAELINIKLYEDGEIDYENSIAGLDFSGPRKAAYLVATRLTLESSLIEWPKNIIGIRAQLSNYDPAKDKTGAVKIPQDIVATMSMSCFAARTYFNVNPEFDHQENGEYAESNYGPYREQRLSRDERSRRARQRDEERIKIYA